MLFNIKRLKKYGLLLMGALVLSCTSKEAPEKTDKFFSQSIDDVSQCLSEYSGFLSKYMDGKSQSSEIHQFWDCHENVLKLYFSYKEPQDSSIQSFAIVDIFKTIKALVPEGANSVDVSFLKSVEKLKPLFLGGEPDQITRAEVETLFVINQRLKQASLNLKDHVPVLLKYFFDKNASINELREISSSWETTLQELQSLWPVALQSGPKIKDVSEVLFELVFPNQNKDFTDKLVQLVESYSEIFIGESLPANDKRVSENISIWADIYVWGQVSWENWLRGHNHPKLVDLLSRLSKNVQSSLGQSPKGFVENQKIVNFIHLVAETFGFSDILSQEGVGTVWEMVNLKLLKGEKNKFTPKQMDQVFKGLSFWARSLDEIESNQSKKFPCSREGLNLAEQDEVQAYVGTLYNCNSLSFSFDSEGRLKLPGGKAGRLDQETVLNLNPIYLVLRPVFLAIGSEDLQLGTKELAILDEEIIAPILSSLKIEIELEGLIQQLKLQIDMFTAYSDANEKMSIFELVFFARQYLSSYLLVQDFGETNLSQCQEGEGFDRTCLEENIFQQANSNMAHIPLFGSFIEGLSEVEQSNFLQEGLKVVGVKKETAQIGEGALANLVVLWTFIESYIQRFDPDGSQVWSYSEVERSFAFSSELILSLLSVIIKDIDYNEGLSLYSFLLAKGYLASDGTSGDPNEYLIFQHWKKFPERRTAEVDRAGLLKVLSVLIGLLGG